MSYPEGEHPSWYHYTEIPDLRKCKEMIEGVKKAVYETGDIDDLEFCLDMLCSMFEIHISETLPVLEKKELSLFLGMVDLTKKYAQTLKDKDDEKQHC